MSAEASEKPARASGKTARASENPARRSRNEAGTYPSGQLTSELGNTAVTDTVVAKVAGIATREMPGVYAMGAGMARAVGVVRDRLPGVTGTSVTQGVTVEVGESAATSSTRSSGCADSRSPR
jgi:hypothetical protein